MSETKEITGIKLDFDSNSLVKAIADSMIEASIGKRLEQLMDEQIKNLQANYDRVLRDVVDTEIKAAINRHVHKTIEENRKVFDAVIAKRINHDYINEIVQRGMDKIEIRGRW